MNNLECLIYISRCTLDPSDLDTQLHDIVSVSSVRNHEAKITGILACQDGYFVQLLEGAPAALDLLMIHLHFDPRHEDIRVVVRDKIPAKSALEWAMIAPVRHNIIRGDLKRLLDNPSASLSAWRNVLLDMVTQNA